MQVDLRSNIAEVISWTDRLFSDQVPFAVAKSLTETGKAIVNAMPAAVEADFDRPVEFTKQGFFLTPARKDSLEATVGIKDRQAQYLGFQVEGGERKPRMVALRLPAQVQLNAYGNVPSGLIRQLIARAKAGRRATKSQSRRFGVSQQVELFYGDPGDGRPAGIYQREQLGTKRQRLVPVIVFPRQAANYRPRFDFTGRSLAITDREFGGALDRNWQAAVATAR